MESKKLSILRCELCLYAVPGRTMGSGDKTIACLALPSSSTERWSDSNACAYYVNADTLQDYVGTVREIRKENEINILEAEEGKDESHKI